MKTFPSKANIIRHVFVAWQATKRHDTSPLLPMAWRDVVSKRKRSQKSSRLAAITWKSWTQTKEICDPESSAHFPGFSAHFICAYLRKNQISEFWIIGTVAPASVEVTHGSIGRGELGLAGLRLGFPMACSVAFFSSWQVTSSQDFQISSTLISQWRRRTAQKCIKTPSLPDSVKIVFSARGVQVTSNHIQSSSLS